MGMKKGKWQGRLEAAEASGMSLSAYAVQHGIEVRYLYDARHARKKAITVRGRATSAFAPVKLKAQRLVKSTLAAHPGETPGLAMQARLDNGVVLSWTYDAGSASAQANLLHTLAGLPCFG